MYNHLNMSINRHSTHGYVQAYVPYDPIKHKTHQQFIKKTAYRPICTNDSSIFERTFYLDYGTTYIVFFMILIRYGTLT